ncbi:glycosyltransferase family 4 protein [Parafilimonas terrae]|uniref:Glycosyltransferase involved in cell wall bisynthesis n=1 Tax=Parafilimonas terrae TaxID=1465490 RepID=A0A1I5WH11_9BACT|nr:glycosyltransferase family 4 protein [Parafilimonas terrae]SFQ18706.1 Glycosyltransferase involved in cell wall bisynthesis [Parafilimonas terrae]
MKHILFIAYDAKRAGSGILLLNLTKAIKEITSYGIDFLFRHDGDILNDFKEVGKVVCVKYKTGIAGKLLNKLFDPQVSAIKKLLLKQYDWVIVNTVLNADVIKQIRRYHKGRLVCYIHELEVAMDFLISSSSRKDFFNLVDVVMVPCLTVKRKIEEIYQVQASLIKILPYYIPSKDYSLKKSNENRFIIGACGNVELRKGTDLFVQLAKYFIEKHPGVPAQFVWIGGNSQSLDYKLLRADINKCRLQNISLRPATKEVALFYAGIDLFVLASREDPYPLVVLEAADACIPTICFSEAGGAPEFVQGTGKVINYLDIKQMAAGIYDYYLQPQLRRADGEKAKAKLAVMHQDKKHIVQQFFDIIT